MNTPKSLSVFCVAVGITAIHATAAHSLPLVESQFASGSEGWVVVDVPTPNIPNPPTVLGTYAVDFISSGGNPGGYINMADPSGNWFMFSAPAAYLGDKSSALGETLSFDLMSSGNPSGDAVAVALVGLGSTLFYTSSAPGSSWTAYSILLSPSGWRLNDQYGGLQPTASEMQSVLSNLQALYISGDWINGPETTGLDSVRLGSGTSPVPEPSTITLVGAGLGALAYRRRRSKA